MRRKTTEFEQKIFSYLNELRESGETNMFGARAYVISEFEIDNKEAKKLLLLWMANFSHECNYEEIEDKEMVSA